MARPGQLVAALGTAVRNREILRAEAAWGAAITAEWGHFVALGVFAYERGGPAAVGLAGLVRLLPAAILAPFAASLGDRFRRERLLLVLALVGAAALAGSAAGAAAGDRTIVFALAAVVGLVATLFRPALQALLPSVARTPEELIAANGATSTIESLGTLVGPLLAGVLIALADTGLVFALGGATSLCAAALLVRLDAGGRPAGAARTAEGARRLLLAGIEAVVRAPRARLVVGLVIAQTFVRGCLNVLIVVAAFEVLDAGAGAVGYMTAAIGVGGLAGAIGAMALGSRRLAVPFGLALVCWGLPIVLIAPRPELAVAVVMLGLVGVANSVEDVAVFTLLQRLVPDEILTRVLGVVWGLAMGGVALGSIAAPAIVDAVGAKAAFVGVGAILPVLSVLAFGRLREIDRAVAPAGELALVERVPMFAPLSLAAKEWIAGHLERREVAAGEVVIRAGDVGDAFFLVGAGDLDVDAGGRRTSLAEGDCFGEIALLRDVPRTATVTARSGCELYALGRADFLAAVAGHAAARAAGDEVVEARLAHGGAR